jgi:hypothetical protein
MRALILIALYMVLVMMVLGACAVYPDRSAVAIDTYSRGEIDAIQAEAACRALARNLVQQRRCSVRP